MGRSGRMLVVALFVTAVVATACDPSAESSFIGVARGNDGKVEVHVNLCPGDQVLTLSLVLQNGAIVGDSEDPVLWSVRARRPGPTRAVYTVGQTPGGFVLRARASRIPAGRDLAAIIDTRLTGDSFSEFRLSDLRRDRIWSEGHSVDRRTFEGPQEHCPS